MDLSSIENFLFVPEPGTTAGALYELNPSSGFNKDSFVLLPYQNPQVKASKPLFFKITKKSLVNDLGQFKKRMVAGPFELVALTSKQAYLENVKKLKKEIQLGNIYEINYCTSFQTASVSIDPVAVFLKLFSLAKAPYSCFLKMGDEFIISASPELFLKKENLFVYTKPIKGTTKRGQTIQEDDALKNALHHNLKERTENVMAVDVARNDLSHFAKKGTVTVNKLYNIETFETVHQMVSTVQCEIKDDMLKQTPGELFDQMMAATFPMASMTGAPKLRAMQLIDATENFRRGSYSGAMGLIDENENYTLSVIIRSIFYNQKSHELSIAVGGAITYLSEPEKEYEECLLKAEALLKALDASIVNP
ncbi:MAG TPA: anthranilate synthase component I family protein [Bacteroidia bacterium]|nr:anthranilate synthase component I family protein [Bacteroidia bacterium]